MEDRRSAPRFALGLACTVRSRGTTPRSANLIDLSITGCRIEITAALHAGDVVWLSIGPIRGICGSVAWASTDFAGIAFANNLHASVVDQLVEKAGPMEQHHRMLLGLAHRSEHLAAWTISATDCQHLSDLAKACRAPQSVDRL